MRGIITRGHAIRCLPPCQTRRHLGLVSLLKIGPKTRVPSIPFVGKVIGLQGCGARRRVTRVRHTYSIATRVRLRTVHILHIKVGRRRITTTLRTITRTRKYGLSFPAVTAMYKRALRGRCRKRAMGRKSVLLISTKTRATVKCTNSVSSAVYTKGGFADHRGSVCSVRITTRRTTIGTLGPNICFHSICSLSYQMVYRNLGKLNLVGKGPTSTMRRKTRTVFFPYKLKRVVKLSIRSVRGLKRM